MELSIQYGCSPATGDYGNLTVENLATSRLFLGNLHNQDAGVIFWTDSTYVPQIATTTNPAGLSNPVDGLLEPTEAAGVVTIDTGVAIVNGYLYFNDTTVAFDVNSNPGNANATDIIALRWTAASQTVRLVRLAGALGSTAVLTQTTTIWDIPITEVELDGSGQFVALTDVRKLAVAPGTLIKINTFAGDGTTGTISFTSIPNVFNHLVIRGQARTSLATISQPIGLTLNGDSGGNYDQNFILSRATSTVTQNANTNSVTIAFIGGASSPASYFDIFESEIHNYKSQVSFASLKSHGSAVGDGTVGASGFGQSIHSGWWQDTSVVNQIDLDISGNYVSGSLVDLYGVV